ncbi:hypothetical protein GQ607_017654 [Colletotrichum asianum]|uniref:Uncharacterized protein n=1 Tax=Colletotrichum asianum TaxID=702518 RepID=A0A8H3ZKJ0_9PEZI|nr:hypothetical protein GQ607_017654 [Colletotrichum asianum]
MAPEKYFHRVSTRDAYNHEAKPEGDWLKSLNKLGASKWGRLQLAALRVLVVEKDASLLPSLNKDENFLRTSSILRFDGASESDFQQEDEDNRESIHALFKLVKGPSSDHHVTRSVRTEYALRREPLGNVWAAMNRLCVSGQTDDSIDTRDEEGDLQDADETSVMGSSPPVGSTGLKREPSLPPLPEERPKRQATQAPLARMYSREDLTEAIGIPTSPSGKFPSSQSYVPQEEAVKSQLRPEELTHRFASEFIRHVLQHLPQQQWSDLDDFAVDFDDHKLQLDCRIQQNAYRSIDDGGLSLVQDFSGRLGRVAILETKRHLGEISNGEPKLSDERFAQMIGQAVSMRLVQGAWVGPQDTIFIIASARYYMRFLEVHITQDYVDQLEVSEDHQKAAAEFIEVNATKWFDLRSERPRNHAVINIAGIVSQAFKALTI